MFILLLFVAFCSAFESLPWKKCTADNFPSLPSLGLDSRSLANLSSSTIDCASLSVPVDWNHPHGENITLGMARYKAARPGKLGSVIYNPGGPGGVASTAVFGHALGMNRFTDATVEHYDVIGLDPRGIGMSSRVKCDPGLFNKRGSIFPTSEKEFEDLVFGNKALGESCRNMTGRLFDHLDTTSAARDLEAVRFALGEKKLNWIGLSYGTQLGGAYAELYPQHVGRMVLDGNLDHSQSETGVFQTEVSTYEDTLNQFFAWCNTTTVDECPFTGQDLSQVFDDLVAIADAWPIPALDCIDTNQCKSPVTGEDIRINAQPKLVRQSEWPTFAHAINTTLSGDASSFASGLATSDIDSAYPDLAIGCSDWLHSSTTLADLQYKAQLGAYLAPHTKGASQSYRYQASCIGWPGRVGNPPHRLNRTAMHRAPPILMVNAYHDPETSYVWAVSLKEQIPSAVLLTRDGSGHTSYGLPGGETVSFIDRFLVNGSLPRENTVVDS